MARTGSYPCQCQVQLLEQYQAAAANLPGKLDLVIREVSSARDLESVFRYLVSRR